MAEPSEAAFAVKLEDSYDLDQIINDLNGRIRIKPKLKIQTFNLRIQTFKTNLRIQTSESNLKIQISVNQNPNFPTSESKLSKIHFQNPNFQNQSFENQNPQPQNSKFQMQPSFEVFTPGLNYMPYTQQTQIACHKCGYPNHLVTNFTVQKDPPRRGAQNPFNKNPKN